MLSNTKEPQKGNWRYLLVAFLLALGLWYTLNAREQIERVVEVRLDYKGLPTGLIVTGGQLNKVSVRLRGPQELLRSMTNREISYTMDLSGVTPGKNVIPLTTGENKPPELRAYEVRGPASVIASMKEIQAEIPVDLAAEGKAVSEEVPLLAPPAVELNPQVVKVTWKIDVKRRTLSLQRDIIFEGENPNVSAQPSRANLMVSVPQAMVKDAGYLAISGFRPVRYGDACGRRGRERASSGCRAPRRARPENQPGNRVDFPASERISGLFRCSITKEILE